METDTPIPRLPERGTAEPHPVSPLSPCTGRYLWYMALTAKWSRGTYTRVSEVTMSECDAGSSASQVEQDIANPLILIGLFYFNKGYKRLREIAAEGDGPPNYLRPTAVNPLCASRLDIKVFHTNPLRWFSAITIVMPASLATTSGSYQLVNGLKASTKP